MGELLREGLRQKLRAAGIPCLVGGIGPIVQVSLTNQAAIEDYRD
jgi:hypothetical protein